MNTMTFTLTPTLCLNMIVKNESKIIRRVLESVSHIIDSYCICDTGSTDNTVEVIQTYFAAKNIPGKIVSEPFRDFGYNRTFALKACADSTPNFVLSDYILLLDADMIFQLNPQITPQQFKKQLRADSYSIFQGSEHFFYKNTRIVKNCHGFTYWGVTHEYVNAPKDSTAEQFDRTYCFINDIGDGGCKSDKFLRDIELLKKGLEEIPDNDRYTFYLANSYRDSGQYEKAIEAFKKRVTLGGWIEEIWHSNYSIGNCYKHLNDMQNAVYYWLEAYNCFPNRVENLYEVMQHYRNKGNNNLAYTFYALADYERKKNTSWDYLFLQKDVYDYKIDYELTIIGYYCNRDKHDLVNTCMKVLAHSGANDGICKNVLSNYKFYSNDLQKWAIPLSSKNKEVLQSIGKELLAPYIGEFVSSTPSICLNSLDNNILNICTRYVNYKIDDNGGYVNGEHIETKNVIATIDMNDSNHWQKTNEFLLKYDNSCDGRYVGLEDVRIAMFSQQQQKQKQKQDQDKLLYIANRGLGDHKIVLEKGTIDIANQSTNIPCQHLLYQEKQQAVEKNWVLFESGDESNQQIKCIYKWSPLTIGNILQQSTFVKTHEMDVPNFFKYVRGSTCGVTIGDEVWFIGHVVSYEDRRYYYHMFVVLDKNTYKLKKYTPLWTFEKSKVEYTLGFVHMKSSNRFLIGYSVMDRESKYIMVSKHNIDDMMIVL